jgi:hypothetical protein
MFGQYLAIAGVLSLDFEHPFSKLGIKRIAHYLAVRALGRSWFRNHKHANCKSSYAATSHFTGRFEISDRTQL